MSKKKELQVVVTGTPRPAIDVDAVLQIVIALGRELAEREQITLGPASKQTEVTIS